MAERRVANAEEMLMNEQRGVVFVGNTVALLVLGKRISGELVIDEHAVLIIVFQLQSVAYFVGGDDVEVVAFGCYRHLSVVIFRHVYFLRNGQQGRFSAHDVVGIVGRYGVGSVRAHANEPALIAHAQDGMHGVYLFVALDVALDRRRRGLHYFLEEAVYLLIRAACKQQRCGQCEPHVS